MPKKKPEMSQVYGQTNNEFIFGENGGRGKHLLSFSKNLFLTGRKTDIREANSNIYGNLSYGSDRLALAERPEKPHFLRSPLVSGLFSKTSSPKPEPRPATPEGRVRRATYTDLDADWDADVGAAVEKPQEKAAPVPTEPPQTGNETASVSSLVSEPGQARRSKFRRVLAAPAISIADLRLLAWNGVPLELRPVTWQLLLGYLPTNKSRQGLTLRRKRQEYADGLAQLPPDDTPLRHQIDIDVRRTHQQLSLYANEATQASLRRILHLWAVRHPASGYVQGINDLCTPFYQIFVGHYLWQVQQRARGTWDPEVCVPGLIDDADVEEQALMEDPLLALYTCANFDTGRLLARATTAIEADTYWCLSRLLDNITDNYIHEQPGIIRQVGELRNLIAKIDYPLLQHLETQGVEFIQFLFRWMNCLLMRELLMELIIRMWDTYLSESPLGFSTFHVYVCAAFLIKFSAELREMDFQEILLFLQNTPTSSWQEKDIEMMLSEAFIWQSLYKNAAAHLR